MKLLPVGFDLLNADVQTANHTVRNKDGRTAVRPAKLIVAFRNIAKGAKTTLAHRLCQKTKNKHILKVIKLVNFTQTHVPVIHCYNFKTNITFIAKEEHVMYLYNNLH
jgi:hypothetical protein